MPCIFPIFLECKEWTLDPFWQDMFEQCANGKFPKGIKMSKDGSINIFTNKSRETIAISSEPFDTFQTMMVIFKEKLGLVSDRDIKKQKKELILLKEKLKEGYSGTWKQIRPKKIRDNLLLDFVISCSHEYNLSKKDTEKLYSIINLGISFKSITSDMIDYSDGTVHGIDGLEFDEKGNFTFDIFDSENDKLEKSVVEIDRVTQTVERYIKDYKSNTIRV